MQFIRSFNDRFWDALEYWMYHLPDKSFGYDDEVAQSVFRRVGRLQVQVHSQTFHSFYPISINCALSAFKLACDTNRVHEAAAFWLLHFFMKSPAAAMVNDCMAPRSKVA